MPEAGSGLVLQQPRGSILKSKIHRTRPRRDSLGNVIKKGGKKHKIAFKSDLADVYEIESFKYSRQDPNDPSASEGKWCCNIQ